MRIDAQRLRGFLDCMHEEADERDKRSEQIRSILKAAKDAGFDTKAIRKVFVRERMDEGERQRQDDLLETYEAALGAKGRALAAISDGVPVGEAAKAHDVHRATLARARHVAKQASNATSAHDPETGEIVADSAPKVTIISPPEAEHLPLANTEADSSTADAGRPSEPSAAAPQGVNACPPSGRVPPTSDVGQAAQSGNHSESAPSSAPAMGVSATAAPCASSEGTIAARSDESCGGVESRHAKAGNMPGSVPGEDVSASPSRLVGATEVGSNSQSRAGVAPGPQDLDTRTPGEIMGEMPAHLRRERAA